MECITTLSIPAGVTIACLLSVLAIVAVVCIGMAIEEYRACHEKPKYQFYDGGS